MFKRLKFKIKNSQSGLTLIEILVATGVFSIVAFTVTIMALDFSKFGTYLRQSLGAQQEVNLTFSTLISEIRSIGPADDGSFMVAQADTSAFTFYSDIDSDGHFDKVRYFLDQGTLKRGVIKPSGVPAVYNPLSENVGEVIHNVTLPATSTAVFSYYDKNYSGNGAPMTLPVSTSQIRVVKIEVIIDETPQDVAGRGSFSMTALIRNLRYVE